MPQLERHWQQLGLAEPDGSHPVPQTVPLADDGIIPNSNLPVLIYRGRLGKRSAFQTLFQSTGWPIQWSGGVFAFQHYHSTAHEVLGVIAGQASLQLGGHRGPVMRFSGGDVLVIPAGVGHCRTGASAAFEVVGGYPDNQPEWDLCRGDPAIHDAAQARIARVPLPPADPVAGPTGPLASHWPGASTRQDY
jgi:uncharacterized protein YjlB